ncbi:MAG: protein BatD [Bacteroidales bacterium]|nr:protein BatD [Bacteroidales bacterium]
MKHKLIILLFFIPVISFTLKAQDTEFKASAPATVRVGQQFQYTVEGSEQGSVTLPRNDAFQVLAGPFSSISTQSQWVNGKMTMSTVVSYTYIFRANTEGEYTLEPSVIKAGRKEYMTNEVAIRVVDDGTPSSSSAPGDPQPDSKAAEEDVPLFMRVIPSKTDVFIGEQLVSALKVYTRVNTRPGSSTKDFPYEGFYKKAVDPDQSAGRETVNGQEYVSQVIQRHILIPQKTGKLVIEPYESEWIIQQRVQRQRPGSLFDDFFDDPFFSDPFGSYRDVPATIRTMPVTINVRPLPPGAPTGFTGGVGSFSLKAELSDDEVNVNEALSLKITITGTGNLPLLGEPEVNLPPDHDLYNVNKTSSIGTAGNRLSGSVTYEYPIVARHAGKFRINPITFSWFNPERKKYECVTTGEFFFTVNKTDTEQGIGQIYVPGAMGERVENIGTDIRDILRAPAELVPLSFTLSGSRWYWVAHILIFLLFVILFVILRIIIRRQADLKLMRNRKASKMARLRLKKADRFRKELDEEMFFEETGKAIWEYLCDKLGMDVSQLSVENVQAALIERGVTEDIVEELKRIVGESEFSRFAPSSEKSNMDDIYRDAENLIKNLEQNLR